MIGNFSWVIPGRLAGAALPGDRTSWSVGGLVVDLKELRKLGIRRLVSLTEYAKDYGPLCREAGLLWTYFRIGDFRVPEDPSGFAALIEQLNRDIEQARAVCVHCYAGIGRTGLVLACALGRYLRVDRAQAIRRLRGLRTALETSEQELFVERFLAGKT